MKVLIASDHAGYELKEALKEAFAKDFEWVDYGTFSTESVDYPDFAHALAQAVENGKVELGIALCGTGNGMAMTRQLPKSSRLSSPPILKAVATRDASTKLIYSGYE